MVNFDNVPKPSVELQQTMNLGKKGRGKKQDVRFCAVCNINLSDIWQENPHTRENGQRVYLCNTHWKEENSVREKVEEEKG